MTLDELIKAGGKLLVGICIASAAWFGQRIVGELDRLNQNLTAILVTQATQTTDITALKAAKEANDQHWKEHEDFSRQFFETYDLKRKK